METVKNLKEIIDSQKEILKQLEKEFQIIEKSNVIQENTELKIELEKTKIDYQFVKNNLNTVRDENSSLKNALYEQIYNEKLNVINAMRTKINIYFKSEIEGEENKLRAIENSSKLEIKKIREDIRKYNIDATDEIYLKISELEDLLSKKIAIAKEKTETIYSAFSKAESEKFESLKKEQITEEQIQLVAKKNNLERLVGLNLLNVIGIFLIMMGAITAARHTYFQLPPMLKGILIFVLGTVMLIGGEMINKKKSSVFSLGITAGGVGILYVAVTASYFLLNILDMHLAAVLCILVTITAFLLSNRYNSQLILSFALIGGYLPMLSLDGESALIYGVMLYFIVLNLLSLTVSFSKKWYISTYIGLILNTVGTLYICRYFGVDSSVTSKIIVIIYTLLTFIIYTFIPINSTYRTKSKFKKLDFILLAINTFFSSLIMYRLFYILGLKDLLGALAVVFAIIYIFLGRVVEQKSVPDNEKTRVLFYMTGLAFVVLVIPLQFGMNWLSLGWLAEGVILTTYGIINDEKMYKRVGLFISGICLVAFILVDLLLRSSTLFDFKYLAMTAGSIIILYAYIHKKAMFGKFEIVYKYFVIINLWFYLLFINSKLSGLIGFSKIYNNVYLEGATAIIITYIFAYSILRIKSLIDTGIKRISMVQYIIGTFMFLSLNMMYGPINKIGEIPLAAVVMGAFILVVVGIFSLLAVRDFLQLIIREQKIGVEWYPIVISVYFMIILTQNLIVQYDLSFISSTISIIYAVMALGCIIFGFIKRYSLIRKYGLGLAILSVIKLILIDFANLTRGYRVVSYFILGIILVAISFIYQYFSKRLELKKGGLSNENTHS